MRIVNLEAFLLLPPGTVFAKYEPCIFEDLLIKAGNCGEMDFFYSDIKQAIEADNSNAETDLLERSARDGISVPLDFDTTGRDGCFEKGQLFAVWETADVQGLIAKLQSALVSSRE